ncbi:AAA family ATPase [Nocardia sp. NBC_00565]|uniref:UvrD-helicase domain-containing protein n=1 Tax=Nocardia sp. NBC_00565 TaxID=2975993 RepID=UPI002E8084B7|nr:UvrD-helicase domain-containing protein [Nocardia sp. NBC_00565]WUC00074.1 AAA family ATPase [Nocardia sp. NBC_00565]
MNADMDALRLDEVQQAIAKSPIDARLLVVAGAGQGKTEVVAARVGHLVREEDLSASLEVLVLSFSRAAVDAVLRRLDLREVARANVRTFDSFANRLLIDGGIDPSGDFDARIRQATKYLAEADEPPYELKSLRHVVIDEIQDLVGDRAEFVLAVLRSLGDDVGITALGDPLQGIYDFQLTKSKSKSDSADVFAVLRAELGAQEVSLDRNYRARGYDPKRVIELGDRLRIEEDAGRAGAMIREFDAGLPHLGGKDSWIDVLANHRGRAAVLCVSNGEVLRTSQLLHEAGVRHVVRRAAQEFGAASWIARALGGFDRIDVARADVEAAFASLPDGVAPDDAWYLLKEAEGISRNNRSLNMIRLRSLIRSGAVPLTLIEHDTAEIIVSTVHKSKGLEYDRVFLVDPVYLKADSNSWPTIRARYVGLSRARDKVLACDIPAPRAWFCNDSWDRERLLEKVPGRGKSRRTQSMEFCHTDLCVDEPYGDELTAREVQTKLSEGFDGARVEARLDRSRSTREHPSYFFVTDQGVEIGRSSAIFDDAFTKAFHCASRWPTRLTGLSVIAVETVAGEPRSTEHAHLGGSGLWLVPRLVGMVRPDWTEREDMA